MNNKTLQDQVAAILDQHGGSNQKDQKDKQKDYGAELLTEIIVLKKKCDRLKATNGQTKPRSKNQI